MMWRPPCLILAGIMLSVPLIALPVFYTNAYILGVLTLANIFATVAASWDIFTGFTGRFNFGQALFFGVGSYATGFLNLRLHLQPVVAIPLAGVFAVIVGVALGYPTLRLRGPYFALATFIFPLIVTGLTFVFFQVFGGEEGLYGLASVAPTVVETYYLSLLMMLATVAILVYVGVSSLGLIFESIREDEKAASAAGIDVARYKLLAFSISAFFTGIAGAYYAHYLTFSGPTAFSTNISIGAIAMSVVGGLSTIVGPVVGAYLLTGVSEGFRVTTDLRVLIYGLVLLLIVLFFPNGILGRVKKSLMSMRIRRMSGGGNPADSER